jgi:hypothetical protein
LIHSNAPWLETRMPLCSYRASTLKSRNCLVFKHPKQTDDEPGWLGVPPLG